MPAVALVGAAEFATALLLFMLAVAIDLVINTIAKALGKFGVGPFSIDLGSIVRNMASGAIDATINDGKRFFVNISDWFQAHFFLFKNLMFQTVAAITQVWRQIDHLVDNVIPDAAHDAGSDAKRYADSLKTTIESDMHAAEKIAASALAKADRDIYDTLHKDVTSIEADITKAVHNGVDSAEAFATSGLAGLKAYVDQQIAAAEQKASDDTHTLSTTLGQAISGVAQTASDDLTSARKAILGTVSTDVDNLTNAIGTVANTEATDVKGLANTVAGDLTTAESYADKAASGAVSTAEGYTDKSVNTLTNTVTGDVSTLTNDINTVDTSLTGDVASTTQALSGDLSNIQGVLQVAIASAVGAVAVRVAKLESCSVGVCDDSPNNFSNLLNDALGIGEAATVLTWLSSVVSDPAGAEAGFADLVGGLYGSGQSLMDSLLSL